MGETVTMTTKELNRLKILSKVQEGTLTQVLAAKQLGLSERQVRRLLIKMKEQGDRGLVSKQRGRKSNRSIKTSIKDNILSLIRNYYPDFWTHIG